MTYRYPIPGYTTSPVQFPENYFYVGNDCCSGGFSKSHNTVVRVYLDYTQAMANVIGGNTILAVVYQVTPVGAGAPVISNQPSSGSVYHFLLSGGMVGNQYNIQALATLSDGELWEDNITVGVTSCGAQISGGGVGGSSLLPVSEALTIIGTNNFAPLAQTPYSNPITLVVNGNSFFNVGSPPDFSVSDKTITWHNTLYSVTPGDRVVALYYYLGGVY